MDNIKLVYKLVSVNTPWVTEDLIHEAIIVFIKSMDNYTCSDNVVFSTHLGSAIFNKVYRYTMFGNNLIKIGDCCVRYIDIAANRETKNTKAFLAAKNHICDISEAYDLFADEEFNLSRISLRNFTEKEKLTLYFILREISIESIGIMFDISTEKASKLVNFVKLKVKRNLI